MYTDVTLTLLTPLGVRILLSSSALTMKQGSYFTQLGASLEEAFCSITEARFDMPYRTIENKKECLFWYLLLRLFTCTSLPVQNPLSLVFKVRCLSG